MVFDYQCKELLLSSGALTHMLTPPFSLHLSTSVRADITRHIKLTS